jgi:xanthine dehydrogenase YagT iron-sulfur-binding subunit
MRDDETNVSEEEPEREESGFSRRDFLKVSGISITVPMVVDPHRIRIAGEDVKIYGPGKVPIALTINGRKYTAEVEPRVTLLETLRHELELTGSKRVCDRASCGACTVIIDGKSVYSCTMLAIEAQGKSITTIEGLMNGDELHPLQQAFVDNDAQQCGFCTPGFVMACKAFLDKHPHPTPADMKSGLGGNICRCGTYAGIREAVMQTAKGGRTNG